MTTMIGRGRDLPDLLREPVSFQQTVPRLLVHRAAVSEVFITDLRIADERTSHIGAQWPRAHSFFGPKMQLHDPMLLAETIRQATLVVAHQAFGVAHDAHFVLLELTYDVHEEGLRLGQGPANVTLVGHVTDVRRRKNSVAGMSLEYDCYRDGERVAGGTVRWRCVSGASYARVRGDHHNAGHTSATEPTPVAPHLVGRHHESDVVLGASPLPDTWLLRVDTGHPVMFDHMVDHVPGMMVVEAARQAAQLLTGRPDLVPACGAFKYARYIELDEPCIVRAESCGDGVVTVIFEQSGSVAVTAALKPLERG
jgi:2-oxo-3-(phosphooxy)propyl 3-oxoalkanoate synthase